MFVTRLISGILLVLAAIAVFFVGGIPLAVVLCLLSLTGCYEIYRVASMEKHGIAFLGYVATIVYYLFLTLQWQNWSMAVLAFLTMLALIIFVVRFPKDQIDKVAIGVFAVVYVSVLLACIYQTRELADGKWLVWMIMIGSWGSDTCAYAVGRLIGKHHFSELSPKKTTEGCIGGVIGAAIIAFVYACYYPNNNMFIWDKRIVFVAVTIICAIISQVGDLAASAIKRKYEVKDFGTLIPGHGGVMDRFDSVIFVAPFVYYLLALVTSGVKA